MKSSTPFYLSNLRKPPNDTDYTGITLFQRLMEHGKLGPTVDLNTLREGYYQFWINSYCYTGWGPIGSNDYVRAYILIKDLPSSIFSELGDYHVVVVTRDRMGKTVPRLVEVSSTDLAQYEMILRLFFTQTTLGTTFYKNVSTCSVHNKKITPKHTRVPEWCLIPTLYTETLELLAFVEFCSRLGKTSYGCMNRNTIYHPQILTMYERMKLWHDVRFIDLSTDAATSNLGTYLIRKLDHYTSTGELDIALEIMEFMISKLHSNKVLLDSDIIPDIVNVDTIKEFRMTYLDKYCYKPPNNILDMF